MGGDPSVLVGGNVINSPMGQGLDGLSNLSMDQIFLHQCQQRGLNHLFLIWSLFFSIIRTSQLTSPGAIGAGLGASLAPPPPMKKEEDDFVAPRGAPRIGKVKEPMSGYRPGKIQSLIMGFYQTFQEGGLLI